MFLNSYHVLSLKSDPILDTALACRIYRLLGVATISQMSFASLVLLKSFI